MAETRHRHVTVALGQGRIGVFAGFGKQHVEVFDVRRETFQRLPCTRSFGDLHGVALGDGRALLVDGASDCVFDLASKRFIATENTFSGSGARWPAMVPLPDGRVFLCSGYDTRFQPTDRCAVFDPKTRRFTPVGRLRVPRAMATANRLPDGRILIAGGCDAHSKHAFDTLEVFDLAKGVSELLPATLHERRYQHIAVTLSDGQVLLAGGQNNPKGPLRSAEAFDPKAGTVTGVGGLGIKRSWPLAARLPSGRVAVFGDQNDVRVVELYCPKERRFLLADQLLIDPRSSGFTVTPLGEGGLLLVGGRINNSGDTLDTAELFTEAQGAPQPRQDMDIEPLVRQLGHDEYSVREAATRKLIEMGPDIASGMQPLLRHDDPEIRIRARTILKAIQGPRDKPRWCVEVRAGKTRRHALWFDDFSCPGAREPEGRRVAAIRQAAAEHKATRLVVRFPRGASHEQRVRLANLVGWSLFPVIYIGDDL